MIRRPPRSTLDRSSAASDVYKRQAVDYSFIKLDNEKRKFNYLVTERDRPGYGVGWMLSLIHI